MVWEKPYSFGCLIALDGEPIKFNREERRLIVLDGEPIDFKHTQDHPSYGTEGSITK